MVVKGIQVYGLQVDSHSGCAHYRSPLDIVAIKFRCCQKYYACYDCHKAVAGHPARVWKQNEFDTKAILCGACGTELTIRQYLQSNAACLVCHSGFNPGCRYHYPLYFEIPLQALPGQDPQKT